MTREEILHDQPRGLKLKDDPFWQYVKVNRAAREMLIAPNESFTSQTVIEKALRQDIGPDPSITMMKKDLELLDPDNTFAPLMQYKMQNVNRHPIIDKD